MKVVDISSRTRKTYVVTIEDGEVRDQPYNHKGRRYVVQRITVVKADGNVDSVTLDGPVLKKDGTAGVNAVAERLYRQGEWPKWLHSIVGGLA